MKSFCGRKSCDWSEEVAHMDEAIDQLQQHYRAIHPTKAFYRSANLEALELYNTSAQEFVDRYTAETADGNDPVVNWPSVRAETRRYRQWQDNGLKYLDRDVLVELEALVDLHEQDIADAIEARAARPRYRVGGPLAGDPMNDLVPLDLDEVGEYEDAAVHAPQADVVPNDNGF